MIKELVGGWLTVGQWPLLEMLKGMLLHWNWYTDIGIDGSFTIALWDMSKDMLLHWYWYIDIGIGIGIDVE